MQSQQEEKLEIDCFVFPRQGEEVTNGEKVILSVIKQDEKEKYLAVSYEYSYMKGSYKDEKFREALWEEFLLEDSFVCSIYISRRIQRYDYGRNKKCCSRILYGGRRDSRICTGVPV